MRRHEHRWRRLPGGGYQCTDLWCPFHQIMPWERRARWKALWRRVRSVRIHVPPRGCPVCGLDVWASSRANRSRRGRVFCCSAHKDYAGRPRPRPKARANAHVGPAPIIACPWPHKVRFDSEEQARTRFHTILAADGQMQPYPCPSTEPGPAGLPGLHWHVGHPHIDDGQRISAIARITVRKALP